MVGIDAGVTAQKLSTLVTDPAHVHVLIILVLLHYGESILLTGGTAPLALRSLAQLRVQTAEMVGSGTGVTQDDLSVL